MEFIKLHALKIYTAEDVMCGDEPFYKAVMHEARRLQLGGGTLFRADEGYGTEIRGAEGRAVPVFFSGSYNLPVLIEIVDSKEKLAELFPFLEKHGNCHFLAVISPLMALYTQYVSAHAARMKRSKLPRIQEDEL